MKPGKYIVFDIETTGFSHYNDEIIEIGAIKVSENKIIDSFVTFCKPSRKIPYNITKLTNINDEMVKYAKTVDLVLIDFLKFIGDYPLVAHNIVFDLKFLNHNLDKYLNVKIHNNCYDTLNLSRLYFKGLDSYSLKNLKYKLNLNGENSHRAMDDVLLTNELFIKLHEYM